MTTRKVSYLSALLMLAVMLIMFVFKTDDSKKQNCPLDDISAVAGKTFTGHKVRSLSKSAQRKLGDYETVLLLDEPDAVKCRKWAVLTTIHTASEAVYSLVMLKTWCLVIVTDCKTPKNFDESGWIHEHALNHVVLLDVKYQEKMDSKFVQHIPWNNLGRKNIGYLYAIQHGAEVIWDFDDDNILKKTEGFAGELDLDTEVMRGNDHQSVKVLTPYEHSFPTFNPYPYLGAPTFPSWPRGLPLKHIKDNRSFNSTIRATEIKNSSIGVIQSLADIEPDVDAIYRLTMRLPSSFKHTEEVRPLLIPHRVLTPYNAQATLYFKKAFWGMFLPVTVGGRVSDIWRSFFTQRLFWDCNLFLAFSAQPLVNQKRNYHDYVGDLAAEEDLYQKGEQLVKFLRTWKSGSVALQERILELYTVLFERQYVKEQDVILAHLWIDYLIKIGYKFPKC